MPMIHLLSTYGVLVSFNLINTRTDCPNICSPPMSHKMITNSEPYDFKRK